jgi:UDP:flavonoid glycosyltransferase YjiC (YdhE family)
MHHGKPMLVLPIFWDQHDNAQRVHETGFGERLATYSFTDDDIVRAIDGLLGEEALHAKLAEISKRLQGNPGNVEAAELIERVAETGDPVTR